MSNKITTNRRGFLVQSILTAGAVSFLRPFQVFAGIGAKPSKPSGAAILTILHTGNLNGQWQALPPDNRLAGLGGLQNITKKIEEIRQTAEAVLLVHSGTITGNHHQHGADCLPFYREFGKAGYDAVTPGTSDLRKGLEVYRDLLQQGGLPTPATANDGRLPYKQISKGGLPIGIIEIPVNAFTSATVGAKRINSTAAHLRNAGQCQLIICSLQDPSIKAAPLAGLSEGVDVMLCPAGQLFICNTAIVKNKAGEEVILSYAGPDGTMVSRIDLRFNATRQRIGFASKAIFIGTAGESCVTLMKRYRLSYA